MRWKNADTENNGRYLAVAWPGLAGPVWCWSKLKWSRDLIYISRRAEPSTPLLWSATNKESGLDCWAAGFTNFKNAFPLLIKSNDLNNSGAPD